MRWAKAAVRLLCWLAVLPLLLTCKIIRHSEVYSAIAQHLALCPGKLGSYLRVAFYASALKHVSRDIYIGFGTILTHPEVSIGRGVYIGGFCLIGMADIGEHATIGSHVGILSGARQHRFDAIGVPIQEQGGAFERVRIGANTWIGHGAIVMNHVGVHNVIAAGAVVTKATGDLEIIAGNPGTCIKKISGRQAPESER